MVKNIGETGHEHIIYIHTFSIFPCNFSLLQPEISLPLGHALVMRAQSPADCLCGNKYPDLCTSLNPTDWLTTFNVFIAGDGSFMRNCCRDSDCKEMSQQCLQPFRKIEFNRVPEFPETNDRMHWQDHESHESWLRSASCIFVPGVSITKKCYVLITLS